MVHCNRIKCCCVAVCPSHFWMALVMPKVNNALLAMLLICTCRWFSACPWLMTQKRQWYQVLPSNWFVHASLLTVNHIYLQRFGGAGCQSIGICSKKMEEETKKMGSKKRTPSPPGPQCVGSIMKFPWKFLPEVHWTQPFSFRWPFWSSEIGQSLQWCSWARPI